MWKMNSDNTFELEEKINTRSRTALSASILNQYYIATTGSDGVIRVWKSNDLQFITKLEGHSSWVWRMISLNPKHSDHNTQDGNENFINLASCSEDGTIRLWNLNFSGSHLETQESVLQLNSHIIDLESGPIRCMDYYSEFNYLICGMNNGNVNIIYISPENDHRVLGSWSAHTGIVRCCLIFKDPSSRTENNLFTLITGGEDNAVIRHYLEETKKDENTVITTSHRSHVLFSHDNFVSSLDLNAIGNQQGYMLLSSSYDGRVAFNRL
eukprot:gb/GECH01010912.1/.p1 GENE.gb/GECH01010912.1/~~gb/GECH01010912.1/.p1  ORF type:complete len:268 (+),score=35.36 gb/GECH01010912.1/:1-804(+)